MKTLRSLLFIISITTLSWATFAKSNIIQVNTLYIHNPSSSIELKPFLSTPVVDENIILSSESTQYKHNKFFEASMLFNEKLQQFIAVFKNPNKEELIANNYLNLPKNNLPKSNKVNEKQKIKVN